MVDGPWNQHRISFVHIFFHWSCSQFCFSYRPHSLVDGPGDLVELGQVVPPDVWGFTKDYNTESGFFSTHLFHWSCSQFCFSYRPHSLVDGPGDLVELNQTVPPNVCNTESCFFHIFFTGQSILFLLSTTLTGRRTRGSG